MRKLLLSLLSLSGLAMASNLDMHNLTCGTLPINAATTLQQVQQNCKIEKQKLKDAGYMLGLYEVEFINSSTNKSVVCDFPRNEPTATVNGCR